MPVTIDSPRFSFVRFDGDHYMLPAYEKFDIAFQFIVNGNLAQNAALKLGVMNQSGQLVNAFSSPVNASILNNLYEITDTNYSLYEPSFYLISIKSGSTVKTYNKQVSKAEFRDYMLSDFGYEALNNNKFFGNGTGNDVEFTFQQFENGNGTVYEEITAVLVKSWGQGYIAAPGEPIAGKLPIGACFRYCILNEANEVLGQTNIFKVHGSQSFLSQLTYYNHENGYEFIYQEGKPNVVRLPISLGKPQWPEEKNVYIRSDGYHKLLSAFVEEQYALSSDVMPAIFHRALKIALLHDYKLIDCPDIEERPMEIIGSDSYEVEWSEDAQVKLAKGSCTVTTATFGYTNSNYE